jgi:hypothetical protein
MEEEQEMNLRRIFGGGTGGDSFVISDRIDPQVGVIVSPDSLRVAYVESRNSDSVVFVNGKKVANFSTVGGLTFSRDSRRLAFVAKAPDGWYAVMDERTFGPWEAIGRGGVTISPDGTRLAYTAKQGNRWHLIVNAEINGGPYEGFGVGGPVFSEDSGRLIHVVKLGSSWSVEVDGKTAGRYPSVAQGSHCFSPDSKTVAVIATVSAEDPNDPSVGEEAVVLDGEVGPTFSRRPGGWGLMSEIYFSPDSKRVAYGVKNGDTSWIIVDGQPQAKYSGIHGGWRGNATWSKFPDYGKASCKSEFIVFSPDSRQCSYAARDGDTDVLIIEGQVRGRYEHILDGPISISPDSSRLAFGIGVGKGHAVIADWTQSDVYSNLSGCRINFSPNSKSVGFVATKDDGLPLLVLNGRESQLPAGVMVGASIIWDDDSHVHTMVAKPNNRGPVSSRFLVQIARAEL